MTDKLVKASSPITTAMDTVKTMAEAFLECKMWNVTNMGQAMVLAMGCVHEGMNPIMFMNKYHLIEDWKTKGVNITRKSRSLHAEFVSRGGRVKFVETNGDICHGIFTSKFYNGEYEVIITMKDMLDRGIPKGKNGIKDNWKKHPKDMLQCRCLSDGVKITDPVILSGMNTQEEIQDEVQEPAQAKVEFVDNKPSVLLDTAETVKMITAPKEEPPPQTNVRHECTIANLVDTFSGMGWPVIATDFTKKLGPVEKWDPDRWEKIWAWFTELCGMDHDTAIEEIKMKLGLEPGSLG